MKTQERPKMLVYIATSIDGYIAKENDGLDWLTTFSPPVDNPQEDYGFRDFLASVDALIMGKNTYKIASSADYWPYEGNRVIVLSSSLSSVCEKAELYKGNIIALVNTLYTEGIRHIYVDGGNTISQFLNHQLIDELIISVIPVILGSGIPLFQGVQNESWCRLISSRSYENGLVQLHYALQDK